MQCTVVVPGTSETLRSCIIRNCTSRESPAVAEVRLSERVGKSPTLEGVAGMSGTCMYVAGGGAREARVLRRRQLQTRSSLYVVIERQLRR